MAASASGGYIPPTGRVVLHFLCVYPSQYPGDRSHPRSLSVSEDRILPELDAWLARLFDREHLEETIEATLLADQRRSPGREAIPLAAARKAAADAEERLQRHARAISAGIDPRLLVNETRQAQADLAKANALLAAQKPLAEEASLTPSLIRETLLRHGGFVPLLEAVTKPHERRDLYASLGLTMTYERQDSPEGTKELVRPAIAAGGAPWSNSACRRGELSNLRLPQPPTVVAQGLGLGPRRKGRLARSALTPLSSRPPPPLPGPV